MTKISLDVKALKYLIDQDPDFALELKQSVVAEFSRRYLKGEVEEIVKKESNKLSFEVKNSISKLLRWDYTLHEWKFEDGTPEGQSIRNVIISAIQALVSKILLEVFNGEIESIRAYVVEEATKMLRKECDSLIKQAFEEGVKTALKVLSDDVRRLVNEG